jgi:hypothetical protein
VHWQEGRIQIRKLGQGRRRRNKNRCVGRLRPVTSGLSRAFSCVATRRIQTKPTLCFRR